MNSIACKYDTYSIDENKLPIPEQLKNKDVRADPAALAAVWSATKIVNGISDLDLASLHIIILNREGCKSHIDRVSSNIVDRIPAQGYFVRSGPQTLATYTALALGSHGGTFTIVGEQAVLDDAISTAIFLSNSTPDSSALLTVIAKKPIAGYLTKTVLISQCFKNSEHGDCLSSQEKIYSHLSEAFGAEINI